MSKKLLYDYASQKKRHDGSVMITARELFISKYGPHQSTKEKARRVRNAQSKD